MDIIEAYKFCPICGKPSLTKGDNKTAQCPNCGYKIYLNPSIGAVGMVFDAEGKLLVVRRSKEPAKDTWHIPGGFVEVGESIEQAVEREIKEELNIDIKAEEYLFSIPNQYQYKGMEKYPLDFFFTCKLVDISSMNVDLSENSDYAFLKPEEINVDDFGLPSIKEAIRRYFHK